LWLFQGFYQVEPDEVGVELLFGKAKTELSEPGIHFRIWPIETVEKPQIRRENKEFIGSGEAGVSRGARDQSQMLSGDQNIIDIDFSVLWRIKDPIAYLFKIKDQPEVVRIVAESAMREVVGRTAAEPVRTGERQQVEESVRALLQKTLDEYQAGVLITGIKIERAEPPREVNDAFEEVQRAQQDQDKFKQNAVAYSNKRLGDANGEASQIREAAKAYKARVIAEADGESQRFVSVYEEYAKAKGVTKKRMYLETMENILKDSNKVIIESQAGSGVVPYLPLPEIEKRAKGVR
jgi:membrane protease subunit HflK